MQSQPTNPTDFASRNSSELHRANRQFAPASNTSHSDAEDLHSQVNEPTIFHSQFVDCMEMNATACTIAEYLDAHHAWFHRCAHPMQVESIGTNSYALIIGRFGAFGYDVEPKIGLNLLPQRDGVYCIETIPVPGYTAAGYEVDFRAALELVEQPKADAQETVSTQTTQVQWQLDLTVAIQFPRFIHALPDALVQRTGDQLLRQVVRQVSRRLTYKVQEDFHSSRGLPMPKRSRKWR